MSSTEIEAQPQQQIHPQQPRDNEEIPSTTTSSTLIRAQRRNLPTDEVSTSSSASISRPFDVYNQQKSVNQHPDDYDYKKIQPTTMWKAACQYMNSTRLLVLAVLCLQNSLFTVLRRYSQGVLQEVYSKVS
jgi:hypothetical protein